MSLQAAVENGQGGISSYGDGEVVPPLGSEGEVLIWMGRSFHHWGVREQFLWGWGDRSTAGERGSSSYGDGEVVPPLESEAAVLMGTGRSFHHWGAREQFLWGRGGRPTTEERGSSSYGDGEVVPPLGSEGAVLMGRWFHHWRARVEKQSGLARASRTAGRMGEAACGSRAEWSSWSVGLNDVL